jgi:hypothetical protein
LSKPAANTRPTVFKLSVDNISFLGRAPRAPPTHARQCFPLANEPARQYASVPILPIEPPNKRRRIIETYILVRMQPNLIPTATKCAEGVSLRGRSATAGVEDAQCVIRVSRLPIIKKGRVTLTREPFSLTRNRRAFRHLVSPILASARINHEHADRWGCDRPTSIWSEAFMSWLATLRGFERLPFSSSHPPCRMRPRLPILIMDHEGVPKQET